MAQDLEQNRAGGSEAQARAHSDFWGIALRHKSLVALGVVVSLVFGALYYAIRIPVYKSDAQVLVTKKRPDAFPLTGADPRLAYYYEDYLTTHQALIKSPLIIGRAVEKRQLLRLKSFAGSSDPVRAIIRSLTVNREFKEFVESSNILNLSFRGLVADECGTVLNAIIESYKDFLDATYKNVTEDTVELITKARDLLQKDLAQKEADYSDFRQKAPLLWKGKDGSNPHQEKLGSIESKRANLLVRRAEIQGRLAVIERELQQGRSRTAFLAILPGLPGSLSSDAAKRSSAMTLHEQLLPLLQQERALLEDYGENHPQVQSIRKRIELTRKHFARPVDAPVPSLPSQVGENGTRAGDDEFLPDPMEIYVQSLKQELQDVQMSEELLAAEFQNEYGEARKRTNYEIQDERYRNDIARTHQLYDGIIKRLQEVNLARDFGGYDAQTIASAGDGFRVEPNAVPISMAALLLGFLGGLMLAHVADRTDKSFRSPEEIRRRLGLPILGHIPLLEPIEEALQNTGSEDTADHLLWAYYRPQSQQAESYRGVRTALYFGMLGKEHRVVQITSPDMADGKTTLVANLGVSIAQMGKKTLLVDADFRRPSLHKVFGLACRVGLASLIQGKTEMNDAIQETRVPGLSILPCGTVPPNPAELLIAPRFKELLDAIRLQYDFVLLDTPPLLAVTDPCVVAPCVDAVLLNIRVSKFARPNAERAKEILSSLGVTVLGVVVNGVDPRGGARGYSCGYKNYHYRHEYWFSNGYQSDNGGDGEYSEPAPQGTTTATGSQTGGV